MDLCNSFSLLQTEVFLFFDEGQILPLSVGIRTNILNAVRNSTGLEKW